MAKSIRDLKDGDIVYISNVEPTSLCFIGIFRGYNENKRCYKVEFTMNVQTERICESTGYFSVGKKYQACN